MLDWLKTIASACAKTAWSVIPVTGLCLAVRWFIEDWLPARGQQVLGALSSKLGTEVIDLSSIPVDWARISQWVPISEALQYAVKFALVWAGVATLKWIKAVMFTV